MLLDDVNCYEFGEFHLDVQNRELLKNGKPIPLTQKTIDLLQYLLQHEGQTIKKDDFFNNIWGETNVDNTNLTQHIYRIRKILENNSDEIYIETIPKYGYRFNADVRKVATKEVAVSTNGNPKKSAETFSPNEIQVSDKPNFADNALPSTESDQNLDKDKYKKSKKTIPSNFSRKSLYIGIAASLVFLFISIIYYGSDFTKASNTIKQNQTVAVLPFRQIGEDKNELLSLGMADSINSKLGNLEEIDVIPIETVLDYSKKSPEQSDQSLFEIGENLGVDILLTGTIQKEKDIVRFNLRLYHVKNQRYLCSVKSDQVDSDSFNLQDRISESVLRKFTDDLQAHKDAKKSSNKEKS